MKKLISAICLLCVVIVCSAQTNYSTWQKQKQDEYAKWKKQRGSGTTYPASNPQQSISNFIDEGFSSQAGQPEQNTNAHEQNTPQNQNVPTTIINNTTNIYNNQSNSSEHNEINVEAPNIKMWAVIVGVASYNHIKSLNYTDDDAYRVYAFFKSPEGGALPDNQISIFVDEDATRLNVVNALLDIYSKASADDVILFYFSGHGAEGAFLTHEYDGTLEDENGNYKGFLLHSELQEVFDSSPARYKYIIADACHSGSSVDEGQRSAASNAIDDYYGALEQSKGGLVMMLSSMGDEVSIETGGLRQGIFSYNLIQGMKGKADADHNKIVSVLELFDYVETNVKEYTNYKQNPVISGKYDANMPIAIVIQ